MDANHPIYARPRYWGLGCGGLIALALFAILIFVFARATVPTTLPDGAIVMTATPTISFEERLGTLEAVASGTHIPPTAGTSIPSETPDGCSEDYDQTVFGCLPSTEAAPINTLSAQLTANYQATMGSPMPTGIPTTTPASTAVPGQQVSEGITVNGFPEVSVPVRWGNGVVQQNKSPIDSIAWMVAEPGVLSADDIAHCAGNLSCVWSGGASVDNLMENSTGTYLCPEGGYLKITYPQGSFSTNGFTVSVDAKAGTAYTAVIRCPYAENSDGDDSAVVAFNTEHAGRMKVMRYPVPYTAGGFFSFLHLEEDLNNSLGSSDNFDDDGADNCGNLGCDENIVILVDLNHASLGVYNYTGPSRWQQLFQNVVRPTQGQ